MPRKENNPAVPITVSEQIESTHACYEAGAALVHVHVRNDDQSTTSNPDKFADFLERIRAHCPDIIVQFSTGGRSGVGSERGGMLHLRPDMASLSTGSCNFPTRVYENPPDLILELAGKMTQLRREARDRSVRSRHALQRHRLRARGAADVAAARAVRARASSTRCPPSATSSSSRWRSCGELMPEATWVAAGIGRVQLDVNRWCLEMGGHCRTGLEDNVRWDKHRLAASNAELVGRVAALCAEYERPVATPAQAREILGLN